MLSGHLQSVPCIRWGGEGLIYSASQDRTIKVWRDEDVSVLVRLMLLLNDLKVSSQEARNVVIVVFQIGNWWSRSYLENACCKKKKKKRCAIIKYTEIFSQKIGCTINTPLPPLSNFLLLQNQHLIFWACPDEKNLQQMAKRFTTHFQYYNPFAEESIFTISVNCAEHILPG